MGEKKFVRIGKYFVSLHFDFKPKKMKKIALFVAALAVMAAAQAQVIVGLHGGYYQQNSTSTLNDNYVKSSQWLGGIRVGYEVMPNLEIHVAGTLLGQNTANLLALDSINFLGQPNVKITDHMATSSRSGWEVAPEVQYTFLKYGNMHFSLSLYATLRQLGYTTYNESFYTVSWPNPNEYHEAYAPYDHDAVEPYVEQVKNMSIFVGVRPSLTYEFSRHLSAEVTLDFLSVGYAIDKMTDDANELSTKTTTFYAGLNTIGTGYEWEAPAFRFGFNWTF